jgi:hypothetical protein
VLPCGTQTSTLFALGNAPSDRFGSGIEFIALINSFSSIYILTLFNWVRHHSVCSPELLRALCNEPNAIHGETPVFLALTFG